MRRPRALLGHRLSGDSFELFLEVLSGVPGLRQGLSSSQVEGLEASRSVLPWERPSLSTAGCRGLGRAPRRLLRTGVSWPSCLVGACCFGQREAGSLSLQQATAPLTLPGNSQRHHTSGFLSPAIHASAPLACSPAAGWGWRGLEQHAGPFLMQSACYAFTGELGLSNHERS